MASLDKIPTAEEMLFKKYNITDLKDVALLGNRVVEFSVEFAKLHVKNALDKIYEESKHGDDEHQQWLKNKFDSYSLENIK